MDMASDLCKGIHKYVKTFLVFKSPHGDEGWYRWILQPWMQSGFERNSAQRSIIQYWIEDGRNFAVRKMQIIGSRLG
ncbi:hypothetical protein RHOFW104T7_06990 [Rhodanobacter thiooxydans]|uniref:Uncharacterized protein n=1 Tax=Rhodanobacter thiooxydans TaxID=416169 RepID=A0A154QKL9_9GAMM|nr:hypothetical protein RHOFW104T7_06990 [Rhodanobacter thiooxydans]